MSGHLLSKERVALNQFSKGQGRLEVWAQEEQSGFLIKGLLTMVLGCN